MQWKMILALLGTALTSSAVTVLIMLSMNIQSRENILHHGNDDSLMTEIRHLRDSVSLLQNNLTKNEDEKLNNSIINPVSSDASSVNAEGTMPDLVMVDPTAEQNQTFEELKDLLDQPRYLESLNLDTLAKSEELTSLPKPLQMVLLSKAIQKFNNGEVDRLTFLGQ